VGWARPRDISCQSTSHGLSPHAGDMKRTLLATSHCLQEWKDGAKSCQVQQSRYTLGIHGAAPVMDLVCASPYATLLKGTTRLGLTLAWPGSHCGVLICVLLGCRNRCCTHNSQIFFSAFGNQNSQMAALVRKDRARLQKGRNRDAARFLTAPVPEMPCLSAWIFSPREFEHYVRLTKIFQ